MSEEKIIGYDPMTGEPIKEKVEPVEEKIVGYDPMTGEPIKEKVEPVEEKVVGYDPMTGAPITEGPAATNTFSQATENNNQSVSKMNLTGSFTKILIGVAAVVVIVLVAVFSGVFTSSHTKVLVAVGNTLLDESKLSKACQGLGVLAEESFTLSANAELEGQEIEAAFAKKKNEMQLTGKVDIENYPEVEGAISINSKKVSAKVDLFDDVLFVYNFKNADDNDGYLMQQFSKDDIEMVNTMLENLTANGNSEEIAEDIAKAALKEYKEWDIEKIKKKKFEVNGKDRNCAGYELKIGEDELQDLVDAVFEALEKHDEEGLLEEFGSQYENMFRGMQDIEVKVYIYKDMLAALVVEVDNNEAKVLFEGGDFRMQNIVVKADGTTVAKLKGKTKGSEERYELDVLGTSVASLEYDAKSGDIELDVDYQYTKISAEANLKGSKNELEFSMDMKDFGVNGEVEVSLKKGAKIQKLSGDEFNVGTADEGDVEEIAEDLMKALY